MKLIVAALLVSTTAFSAQAPARAQNGGILMVTQDFGRAHFSRCVLTVWYGQPSRQPDRAELSCTYHNPQFRPAMATRPLSAEDVAAISTFVLASDLYSGGHVGKLSGGDAPSERLEVLRCCGRDDSVVLITGGNPSFSSGPRRELLNLLHRWREPLMMQRLIGARPG